MKKKEESNNTFPLNTPELIGDYIGNHSPGDRTLLPMAFRFFGCLTSSLCNSGGQMTERYEMKDEPSVTASVTKTSP